MTVWVLGKAYVGVEGGIEDFETNATRLAPIPICCVGHPPMYWYRNVSTWNWTLYEKDGDAKVWILTIGPGDMWRLCLRMVISPL